MRTRHSRTSRWPRMVALGGALAALAPLARADDPAPPPPEKEKTALESAVEAVAIDDVSYPLPSEIVVSASRGVPLTYPGGRDVIGSEVLRQYPDGNVSTVLRRVPGVVILPENGNDSRANFGIRGNDPRRSGLTTVLVDGVPASEAPYGNTDIDGLPIAFERIDRIDVIRGGASIRWGPNSAGGVINLLTEPIPEPQMLRLAGRYGSNGAWSSSLAAGGTWDRFGTLVTIVDKGGDGWRDNSEYDDQDGSAKFSYALSDRDRLNAAISRFVELDAEQPGGLTQAAYDDDPDQSLREGADFRFTVNTYRADWVHETSTGSFQLLGWWMEGFRQLNDFRPILQPFEVTRVQESDFRHGAIEARTSWTTEIAGLRNSFFHSARYLDERNREFYYRQRLDNGTFNRPYDLDAIFTGTALSLFTEDVITLTEGLDFAAGCRHESIEMDSLSRDDTLPRVSRDEHYRRFLPETSLTWTPTEGVALYGSFQKNFMTPQYETGFDPTSTFYRNVDPEKSKTGEIGARVRYVPGLEVATAYFRTDFTDKIEFVNLPSGQKVSVNSGETKSHGLEVSVSYDFGAADERLSGLSLYGTYTQQRSKIEEGEFEGNDSPHSPHHLASWGGLYQHRETGLWARVGGSYTGKSFKDPDNFTEGSDDGVQGPEPEYTLWDAAIGWNQNPDRTGFAVSAGVTNLFDEEYFRRFSSGIYPGAPRELFVGASWTLTW